MYVEIIMRKIKDYKKNTRYKDNSNENMKNIPLYYDNPIGSNVHYPLKGKKPFNLAKFQIPQYLTKQFLSS